DPERQVGDHYGVTGYPETFVIDRNGYVVEHVLGPRDWAAPDEIAALQALIAAGDRGGAPPAPRAPSCGRRGAHRRRPARSPPARFSMNAESCVSTRIASPPLPTGPTYRARGHISRRAPRSLRPCSGGGGPVHVFLFFSRRSDTYHGVHGVQRMIGKRRKTWVGAIGLAVLLAVLFSGGRGVQKVDAVPKESYEGLETFTNILSIIQ